MARKIVFESRHYSLLDNVLHHENPPFPGRACPVVPRELCNKRMEETHGGIFAGHFTEKKVYDRLCHYIWWPGLCPGICCLIYATRKGSQRTHKPPLTPIPVGGPFHSVAVDILQLPQTVNGNCYVAVSWPSGQKPLL